MWIFHNFPSVVHISSISLIFLTFSQHVDWWHSPPKTLVDTADSFAAGLFEQWKKALFFRVNPMRNCAFNGIPLISGWWFGTWLYFSLFSIYWEKVSQVNFIFFREVEFTNQLLLCMYTSIHPIICIYIIVLYVYICIYNRVLRTKWLMMVRYASETWVNIHVSYCWCGWDPWDQHLCCFSSPEPFRHRCWCCWLMIIF